MLTGTLRRTLDYANEITELGEGCSWQQVKDALRSGDAEIQYGVGDVTVYYDGYEIAYGTICADADAEVEDEIEIWDCLDTVEETAIKLES